MPNIIPIRDLKNTSEISELCHSTSEPVFITKNGYGDMVIMSMETYERTMFADSVYKKLEEAQEALRQGHHKDSAELFKELKEKYSG